LRVTGIFLKSPGVCKWMGAEERGEGREERGRDQRFEI